MTTQLYLGDCLEVMKSLLDGSVDAVITDPPYDVGYAEWDEFNHLWFAEAKRISPIVVFTCGIANINRYPAADWVLCWAKPGSTRRNATGGFNHWEPVLFYGHRRIWTDYFYLPDCINHAEKGIEHPCPKPLNLLKCLVETVTEKGASVLDPFMGSGTTGVACVKTGRNFIGVEIEERYFKIAEKRIAEAQMQTRMEFA